MPPERGLGCSAHDPTEDTERMYAFPGAWGDCVVAAPTIRLRILKVMLHNILISLLSSCSAHDPTEDTESIINSFSTSGKVVSCSAHDPTEDTESVGIW